MSQLGEAIKVALLDETIDECPFQGDPAAQDPNPDDEDYAWDDRITMAQAEANSGSRLGNNVKAGLPGKSGTWNALGADPPRYEHDQIDTGRTSGKQKVKVRGKSYPFTVAAHHLIPGNASLYKSELFNTYMQKDGEIQIDTATNGTITFTVSHNIGFNVNGSHNGVWLPGSYAIRAGGQHPSGATWGELIRDENDQPTPNTPWCYDYMASVVKKARGQFHDTHEKYNENALAALDTLTVELMFHQAICEPHCQKKKKLPPPYEIKAKLHNLSDYFRKQTKAPPRKWRFPWLTSDQVYTDIRMMPLHWKRFQKIYRKRQ